MQHGIHERRSRQRVDLGATAVLMMGGQATARFVVQNLSARGALLTGSAALEVTRPCALRLELSHSGPVSIRARVVRRATIVQGLFAVAVEFVHRGDSEDAVQQAVLLELEAAAAQAPFFKKDVESAYA